MKKFCFLFVLLNILVLALSACQSFLPLPTPTITPIPSQTPTITPTSTITPTPTNTPLPPNIISVNNCNNLVEMIQIGGGQINQMQYSADGKYLLIAASGGMGLYDVEDNLKPLWVIVSKKNITQVGISTSEKPILALDSENSLHIFDFKTGHLNNSITQNDGFMSNALANHGEKIAGATFDGMVYIYETDTLSQIGQIKGPGNSPDAMFADSVYLGMEYSPNADFIALATLRAEVYIYKVKDGRLVRKIEPLTPDYDNRIFPEKMIFSQDGKTLAIEYQNEQTLVFSTSNSSPGKTFSGTNPSISPTGKEITLKTERGVEVFQVSTGKQILMVELGGKFAETIFSPDNQYLMIASHQRLETWNLKESNLTNVIATTFSDFTTAAFTKDGESIVTGSWSGLEIFKTDNGSPKFIALKHPVLFLKILPDDQTIIAAGGKSVSIWDNQNEKIIQETELDEPINALDISASGTEFLIIQGDGSVVIFDLDTNQKQLMTWTEKIIMAQFASDGSILALDAQNKLLLAAPARKGFSTIEKPSTAISFQLSPGRTILATKAKGGGLAFYDLIKSKALQNIVDPISAFDISPLSNAVAYTGDFDGTLKLHEVTGLKECSVPDFKIYPLTMNFSPDGKFLIIIDRDGIIHILSVKQSDLSG